MRVASVFSNQVKDFSSMFLLSIPFEITSLAGPGTCTAQELKQEDEKLNYVSSKLAWET